MIDRFFSPKGFDQPFLWFANYGDNKMVTEFEDSGKENTFKSIEKDKVKEFGLLGRGDKLKHDISTGIFDIYGHIIEFSIKCENGDIISLTEQKKPYNDIITYKLAAATGSVVAVPGTTNYTFTGESNIIEYFFGYKYNFISDNGININSKIIFSIPIKGTKYFNIRLVADKEIKGTFIITVDNNNVKELDMALSPNEAQELKWEFIC